MTAESPREIMSQVEGVVPFHQPTRPIVVGGAIPAASGTEAERVPSVTNDATPIIGAPHPALLKVRVWPLPAGIPRGRPAILVKGIRGKIANRRGRRRHGAIARRERTADRY